MSKARALLVIGIVFVGVLVVLIMSFSPDRGGQAAGREQVAAIERPEISFERDPRIVKYQLKRLSNQELVAVERSPDSPKYQPAYEALLTRSGLDPEYRHEAIRALAELKNSNVISEILSAMERIGSEGFARDDQAAIPHQLSLILLDQDPSDLANKHQLLEEVATRSEVREAREAAFTGLVMFAPPENVWELASNSEKGLTALIRALALVPDSKRTEPFYPRVKSLLGETGDKDLRRAVIEVFPSFPMHREESFKILADFIQKGAEPDAAIRSIQRIPRANWVDGEVEPLVEYIVGYARQVPAGKRTESPFLEAVQLGNDLASMLDSARTREIRAVLDELGVRIIVIRTVPDQMRYDKMQVVAEVGEQIQIIFENRDYMLHNLVITIPGAREEIGMLAERMPPEPDSLGRYYVPRGPRIRDPKMILQATKLVAPNEKEKLSFVAPDEPGNYPYLCTFPGHWRLMYGDLVVVADMDEYLADPTKFTAAPQVTEWKVADLASELSEISADRSAQGREVFTSAACVRCHQYSN
ncbi:plastocyanin/azurin family copper-binding protein, partial [Acidobacteria bacterium AH-259-L09]|nr:plastocyanin/azurin family copper-binding protein [Acidobacteria bacterium AH-259-L09]